jgi:hypothetical protein
MDVAAKIAEAVLYEGYLLWPYRRSATKNQKRWTFGGVYPRAWSEARAADDRWWIRSQLLVEAQGDATLRVRVRFLHVVERRVARRAGASLEFVDELTVDGERYLSWQEAVEREVEVRPLGLAELLVAPRRVELDVGADTTEDALGDGGAIVRSWEALHGAVEVELERVAAALFRLTVRVENTTPWTGEDRESALARTLCSTHAVIDAEGAAFVSPTDPPDELRAAAEACENVGVWPVLVGEEGSRDTALCSPIILPDYPQIAPESPGGLFDSTEIDGLLILSVLGLTDEEKEEMRASDPRAREILERVTSLPPEQLVKLHGAIRDFRPMEAP